MCICSVTKNLHDIHEITIMENYVDSSVRRQANTLVGRIQFLTKFKQNIEFFSLIMPTVFEAEQLLLFCHI